MQRHSGQRLEEVIAKKQSRRLRANKGKKFNAWFGLGTFGLLGWTVSIPTIAGALLGYWLDRHHPWRLSWTISLLLIGLLLGCANAWAWLNREQRKIQGERESTGQD